MPEHSDEPRVRLKDGPEHHAFLPQIRRLTAQITSGLRVAGYEVHGLIGFGGMGAVFRGTRTRDGLPVALKFLVQDEEADPRSSMVRFRKQGEEIRNLSHSAIVPVLDVFREMGHNVVVMKLFLGPYGRPVNLTDYSRDFGPANSLLDEQDMQQIITVVLHTLTHAHDHGIVHCDLKPENILFQYLKMDDPQHWLADVRITDFGLAKIVGEELLLQSASQSRDTFPTSMLTATAPPDARALIGTYEYMSPEQRRGYPASPYSDIFAVGVMMLRMLTGYTELGLRMRPSTLRPGLSPDWDDIIIRAMRESPPQRFASPAELAEAVAGIKLGDTARDSRNEDFKSRTVRLETRPWD